MKAIFDEYLKIIMYIIFGILLVMSSYTIILNFHHYKSLSSSINVSEADTDYKNYKDNVVLIEKKIEENKSSNELYSALSKTLNVMKKDGVFRLVPKSSLQYNDLYELNDYFMEGLINSIWVHNLKELDVCKKYQTTIDMLSSNSNYLNTVFTGNSLILTDSDLNNRIDDNYHFILKNYLMFSNIILDISNELGGEDV